MRDENPALMIFIRDLYLYFCLETKVYKSSRRESSAKNLNVLLKFLADYIEIFLTLLIPKSDINKYILFLNDCWLKYTDYKRNKIICKIFNMISFILLS